MDPSSTLVLDNGGYSIKAGFAADSKAKVIPNWIVKAKHERKRVFVADQVDELKEFSSLYYMLPFQKGYLVNWDVQRKVWDHIFGKDGFKVKFHNTSVLFTEPYFNFRSIQEALHEIFFEEYEVASFLRVNPALLSAYNWTYSATPASSCVLVVDCGYSFTHIVPFLGGRQLRELSMRINVGGKALTNHLKEIVSYRQLHVLDETYVMNQCKEDACYVSTEFWTDMARTKLARPGGGAGKGRPPVVMEYVLPDFSTVRRGYLREPGSEQKRDDEQVIKLGNERFSVPELLFHPSDVGIEEMGLPEAINRVIGRCPDVLQPLFYAGIVLTGGCFLFKGIRERLENEIRSICPNDFDVKVTLPPDPIGYAWEGGAELAKCPYYPDMVVRKKEYEEFGGRICMQRFNF